MSHNATTADTDAVTGEAADNADGGADDPADNADGGADGGADDPADNADGGADDPADNAADGAGDLAGDDAKSAMPPFRTYYTLYYHNPVNTKWDIDSYQKIPLRIDTPERLVRLQRMLQHIEFHHGMFFLMREDIKPTWEDERNRAGGCFSYKVQCQDIARVWFALASEMVCESMSTVAENRINGISISPKRGFCILKIWNADARFSVPGECLTPTLPLQNKQAIYKRFQ